VLPHIYWSALNWEAFATLATGFAAVAAAFTVGRKQVAIAEQQKEILSRQVALDELKLRSELFERRFAVYEATRSFLSEIMVNGDKVRSECESQFLIALDQSTFLFHAEVRQTLLKLWEEYCGYGALRRIMTATYESHGHYGQNNPQKEADYLTSFDKSLRSLGELFDEMRLA